MTWIDKLREVLPNSVYVKSIDETIVTLCPYRFFGKNAPNYNRCFATKCKSCWYSEVK